jgi:hypothetical protein
MIIGLIAALPLADTFKEALDRVKPAAGPWAVPFPTGLQRRVKSLQQLLLLCRQVHGRLDSDLRKKVTHPRVTNGPHPFTAQSENLAGLSTSRNF